MEQKRNIKVPLGKPHTFLSYWFGVSLGISHQILQCREISVPPANEYCVIIFPLNAASHSLTQGHNGGRIIPGPVLKTISGVKSCQTNKAREKIYFFFFLRSKSVPTILFQLTFSLDTPETSDFLRGEDYPLWSVEL